MAPISSSAGAGAGSNQTQQQLSPTTTTSLQDMSAAAAAIALDMKPKKDVIAAAQTQKIKKLVRRNASDKLKLIQMVHDNPILWDSRLPNFKGAEEDKNRAWEHIGREFNAPGRRVARAFKSLRESYRRELAHVKLMGSGFKPKWSLYEAMDFLRDVIRERKGGSHAVETLAMGLNLSALATHHMNNNNNNNNNNNHSGSNKSSYKLSSSLHASSPLSDSALNLSKCPSLSQDDYYNYAVKAELDLSTGSGAIHQPLPAHKAQLHHLHQQFQANLHQQQQQHQFEAQLHNDSRVSSTRNDAGTAQHTTFDDVDVSSMRSDVSGDVSGAGIDDADGSIHNEPLSHEDGSDEVEELEAIDADFPYPLILDSNSPTSGNNERAKLLNGSGGGGGNAGSSRKRKRRHNMDITVDDGSTVGIGGGVGDAADGNCTDDEYEDQMLQQHRHLRQQQQSVGGGGLDIPPPQTVREVLNSKFCGFISAKLNSMEDSDADNLMNRILMLLVQTQCNELK